MHSGLIKGLLAGLILLPCAASAAFINVYDSGRYYSEQTVDRFNVLGLTNQTARLVDDPFANPNGTSMIVLSGHSELDVDGSRLMDYINRGGRVLLSSDYNNTGTYPFIQSAINDLLTDMGLSYSITGRYGAAGGDGPTYDIARNTNVFGSNIFSAGYAVSGTINGVDPADVLITGKEGQVLFSTHQIGDGYLFLQADSNLATAGFQLKRNIATLGGSIIPIPAAVWLFGSALAGLGWLRRRPSN